jgi:hypothetical protein
MLAATRRVRRIAMPRTLNVRCAALVAAALIGAIGAGCADKEIIGAVDVNSLDTGGDRETVATLDIESKLILGVDPGDAVVFHSLTKDSTALATITSTPAKIDFYKLLTVDDPKAADPSPGRVAVETAYGYRGDRYRFLSVDIGTVPDMLDIDIVFTVTNVGRGPVDGFLLVQRLPLGASLRPNVPATREIRSFLGVSASGGEWEWELDRTGNVLVREPGTLPVNAQFSYILPVTIVVPGK